MAYNNYFPATYQPAYYPQNAYQTQFQPPQAPQMPQQVQQSQPTLIVEYAAKSDLEPIWNEINALKEKVTPKKVQAKKKEEDDE